MPVRPAAVRWIQQHGRTPQYILAGKAGPIHVGDVVTRGKHAQLLREQRAFADLQTLE